MPVGNRAVLFPRNNIYASLTRPQPDFLQERSTGANAIWFDFFPQAESTRHLYTHTALTYLYTITYIHIVPAVSRTYVLLFRLHSKLQDNWKHHNSIWTYSRRPNKCLLCFICRKYSLHLCCCGGQEGSPNLHQKLGRSLTHSQKGNDTEFPRRKTIQRINNTGHVELPWSHWVLLVY